MTINVVGNYGSGYVGETGDLNHVTREMEDLGHTVQRVSQDVWKAHVDGESNPEWRLPIKSDINIICKWHHFTDGRYIEKLREESTAPVFLWVWDYMWDQGIPDWHLRMVFASDLYLGNDVRCGRYPNTGNLYYFPFDVADEKVYEGIEDRDKEYDVAFFGSWIGQGDRQVWLREINKTNPVTVFSWNHQDWPKEFDARPAVYWHDFVREVKRSKIILGFNVEPNCWGYWSNRVGKTLLAGGFLLQQYAPGMELFLRDGVEYFSSVDEAREKIDFYLIADTERNSIAAEGHRMALDRFSSRERVKDLLILIERYLKKGDTKWQI